MILETADIRIQPAQPRSDPASQVFRMQPLNPTALISSPPDCHWPLYTTLQTLAPVGWATAPC